MVLNDFCLSEICWFAGEVFENASVNTLLSFIRKQGDEFTHVKVYSDTRHFPLTPEIIQLFRRDRFKENDSYISIFGTVEDELILSRIKTIGNPLITFARPCSGYNPYEVGSGISPSGGSQTETTVEQKPYHSSQKHDSQWKPEIIGRDIRRYHVNVTGMRYVKYGPWLSAPRDPSNFQGKRILVQEITGGKDRRIVAAFYEDELYYSRDVIPIKLQSEILHPFYLLALINSRLLSWFHHKCSPKSQKTLFPKILVSDLKKIPIREVTIDKQKPIIDIAEQIMAAKALDPEADTAAWERKIDQLVYELYGLTEEEIAIVEGR